MLERYGKVIRGKFNSVLIVGPEDIPSHTYLDMSTIDTNNIWKSLMYLTYKQTS